MLAKPTDNVLPIEGTSRLTGRHIGAILMDEGKLTPSDAEQVLKRQRELGWRFGEAAIELNLITDTDLREALAKQYEFPYLVGGPDGVSKELVAAWDPFHPVVEELRAVRTQLLIRWFNPAAGRRTLVIASPGAREGRSFIAANLAVSFSQLGQRTLLIDADFRAPRQQGIFNIADRFGLSSVLSGRADLSVAAPVAGITGLALSFGEYFYDHEVSQSSLFRSIGRSHRDADRHCDQLAPRDRRLPGAGRLVLIYVNLWDLYRLGLPREVGQQRAELLRDLRSQHPAHDPSQRTANLDGLADFRLCSRRLDPAVEAKGRARHDTCDKRKAARGLNVDQLHLVMLTGLGIHDPCRARSEPTMPVHRRHIRIPFAPGGHVRPHAPDLLGRCRRFHRGAVLARHSLPPSRPAQLSTRVSAGGDVTSAAFSFVRFKRMMTPISSAVPTSCTP